MKEEKLKPWITPEDSEKFIHIREKDGTKASMLFIKEKVENFKDDGEHFINVSMMGTDMISLLFTDPDELQRHFLFNRRRGLATWLARDIVEMFPEVTPDFVRERYNALHIRKKIGHWPAAYFIELAALLGNDFAKEMAERIINEYPTIIETLIQSLSMAATGYLLSSPNYYLLVRKRRTKNIIRWYARSVHQKLRVELPSDLLTEEKQALPTEVSFFFFSEEHRNVLRTALKNIEKYCKEKLWESRTSLCDPMPFENIHRENKFFQELEQDIGCQEGLFLHTDYVYHILPEDEELQRRVATRMGKIFSNYAERRISKKSWKYTFSQESTLIRSLFTSQEMIEVFLDQIQNTKIKEKLRFILLFKALT